MPDIRRTESTVLTGAARATIPGLGFMCVATAFWAMWTMLVAAFDSDWLKVALTLMLWTVAAGASHLCLISPQALRSSAHDRRHPARSSVQHVLAPGHLSSFKT